MTNHCGGKTRSGGKCKRPAGWGTDHAGTGKCKLHGGSTLRGVEHPNFKHGGYTKYIPDSIREKAQAFEADANPTDLLSELAMLRAFLAEFLSRYEGSMLMNAGSIQIVLSLSNDIRKYVDTIVKLRNQTALTAAELMFIADRIPELAAKYIDDPDLQEQFIAELFSVPGFEEPSQHQITADSRVIDS